MRKREERRKREKERGKSYLLFKSISIGAFFVMNFNIKMTWGKKLSGESTKLVRNSAY